MTINSRAENAPSGLGNIHWPTPKDWKKYMKVFYAATVLFLVALPPKGGK
jgi:hypothetical protein